MTDLPGGADPSASPDASSSGPLDAPAAPGEWPPAMDAGVAPPVGAPAAPDKPNFLRVAIIVGLIFGFLGVVLFVVKDNLSAGDLMVGHCFDVPTTAEDVSTVTRHEYSEPHDAEVFFLAEYSGDSYPIDFVMQGFVSDTCIPVFASYVGESFEDSLDYDIGYFYPNRDGWDGGDRTVTCYIARTDEAKLTQSVKGIAGS